MAVFLRQSSPPLDPLVAPGEPDAVLVARAVVDQEAFAPLYLRYVEEIARFCYLRLRDEEAARDATQQVFVRALAALGRYRETGHFRAWLYTISRNVLTDLARGGRSTLALDAALEIVDPGPTPEELAAAAVEHRALFAALARLPDDQRTAIELRLAGLNGPEAAAAMGRSYGAVKMLQLRAMERLRTDLLSPEEDDRGA